MTTHSPRLLRVAFVMRVIGVVLALSLVPAAVQAQRISVKSATPPAGEQGTVALDVVIAGSGFGPGAQAKFVLSGTDNPDGIRVKGTRFVSNTQLVATIDIDATASLALFDIKVAVSGRSGKGTDLFQVVQKGTPNVCAVEPLDTMRFQLVGTLNSLVAGSPLFQGVFGADVKARRVTLTYGVAGSREVLLLAVSTGEGTGRVEIFFLDPSTGVVLDGTQIVPGGPVQPHVTIMPQALTAAGGALAIGDVNGDGLPDLVSQRSSGDQVTLMVATRAADGVIGYTATLVPPPAQSLKFGISAAMGDVTGDGRDEIVLGKILFGNGKNVEYPAIHVYTAPTGTPVRIASVAAPEVQVKIDSRYGGGVAVGDVTGDGLADVMVAASHWKVGDAAEAGAVFLHVATGHPGTVLASTPVILTGPSPASFDHFASRIAVGNLDGDPSGQVDALALDDWGSSETTGDVFVGPLLASGQTTSPSLRIAPRPGLTYGWGNRGAAVNDIDGNDLTDIVVGAPNAPEAGNCNSIGIAYVYLAQGSPSTGTTGWVRHSIQPPTIDGDYSAFGWSTATAAGSPLIVIGERDRDLGGGVHAGQVYLYRVLP